MRSVIAALKSSLLAIALTGATVFAATPAVAPKADAIDIPFVKFQLDNGLTVVVHEDHKAPVVAVAVWYHVGSADEPTGKTGFAHLFEHLMFYGSENHTGNYFQPFELAGATDMNGTTVNDRTNYFETMPTTALDMALWMESDRMGHLLGAIDQKRTRSRNAASCRTKSARTRTSRTAARGGEHPGQRLSGQSSVSPRHDRFDEGLERRLARRLSRQWFRTFYGAANTTLVLAGDITPASPRPKVQKYFGDIPAGPPVPRLQPWVAPRSESTRGAMSMDVPLVHIYREWNVPQDGARMTSCSISPPRCSAAARPRACTSAWYTRTSSPTKCRSGRLG